MIIVLHVIIAIASMAQTSYAYVKPSTNQIRTSYLLVALTLISGFYLVVTQPGSLVQACAVGLVYLAVVSFGIAGAIYKLSAQPVRSDHDNKWL